MTPAMSQARLAAASAVNPGTSRTPSGLAEVLRSPIPQHESQKFDSASADNASTEPLSLVAPQAVQTSGLTRQQRAIFVALIAAVAGAGLYYLVTHYSREFTDDAQLDGDIVAIPSQVSAIVKRIAFVDNQRVRAGDLLVEFDAEITEAKIRQAEAALELERSLARTAEAEAEVTIRTAKARRDVAQSELAGTSVSSESARDAVREATALADAAEAANQYDHNAYARAQQLLAAGVLSTAELELSESKFRESTLGLERARAHLSALQHTVTQAQLAQLGAAAKLRENDVNALTEHAMSRARAARDRVAVAEANLRLARIELSHMNVFAPAGGIISKRSATSGQMLSVGQPIAQLIPDQRFWVTANFKETQLRHLRFGQAVKLRFDVDASHEYSGTVENIAGATGAKFALLPPDNATGNFTKVVQRVPVRIRLDAATLPATLVPGTSVEVTTVRP